MLTATIALALAAATWPPAWLSAADAKRVEAGQVVQTRTLNDSEIVYTITGRVEAPPAVVSATARDLCGSPPPPKGGKTRFLSVKVAERALAEMDGELDEDVLEKLPALSCKTASGLSQLYVYVVRPGQFMLPDMRLLLRQQMRVNEDGTAVFRNEKVLGGLSEDGRIENETRLVALPDGTTAWALRGVFGIPSLVPDFLVEQWMDTPAEENPQLKRLAHLKARVKKRIGGERPPPPGVRSGSRGG